MRLRTSTQLWVAVYPAAGAAARLKLSVCRSLSAVNYPFFCAWSLAHNISLFFMSRAFYAVKRVCQCSPCFGVWSLAHNTFTLVLVLLLLMQSTASASV
eukprot:897137-Pelagomonas_calceolata.AAC.2